MLDVTDGPVQCYLTCLNRTCFSQIFPITLELPLATGTSFNPKLHGRLLPRKDRIVAKAMIRLEITP